MTPPPKLLGLLCAVTVFTGTGCQRHADNQTPPTRLTPALIQVARAENRRQIETEEIAGTVRAKTRATLEAKLSGRIQEFPVYLGQVVKKGDLIARLDAAETKARLDHAQAALEQADRDWNRISSLFKGQAVTRAEFDRAEAQQRLAKAATAEAEALLRYAEVTAPFDGVVSRKWAEVGDQASPGKPLVDVEDPSSLQLEADVPESIAARIHPGAALSVRVDSGTRELEGKVAEIAPSADPANRTVRVKATLAPSPGLIPGRFARLLAPIGENETVTVPGAALVQRGQLEMVFVITNNLARLHLVKSGKALGAQVVILSGLSPGEMVAVEGASLLVDGQPVEVR